MNNPLTGILTFSHLLRQKMPDKSPDAEDMDLVIRETKRCAAIIKRLLDFAREKQPEKKFTDLNQVIDDTVRIVEKPAHLRDIEITVDLDRTLAADLDRRRSDQAGGHEHAGQRPARGRGEGHHHRQPPGGAPDPRTPASEPKPMVAISIVDTGCGIPEKNLKRIFDPFFTSKDVGKGTGLGLSVSHGIVEAHGGLIEVESKVGEGSTFRVFLPLTPPSAGPESKASGSVHMSARILIVDDEEIVIRSCLRILDGDEFQVEAVQDGREALRKIEENPYDVMILDIMMPNMDGLEVLRRVKETHPNVDVIMITGLSQIDTAVQAMKLGAFDYISKPFEPDELKLVVQRALERRRLLQENLNLKSEVRSKYRFENIIGLSPQMQAVYPPDRAMRADQFDRADHRRKRHRQGADRARDPLQQPAQGQAVRSGRLQCVEREPAGKRAVRSRQGRFHRRGGRTRKACSRSPAAARCSSTRSAISRMSIQAKLLRVLQEREFRAVGDTRTQTANFRLVTATNKDLKAMVAAGTFRDDLYYRINIFPIHAPALRERARTTFRRSPIISSRYSARSWEKRSRIFPKARSATLVNYGWPGNVRELENVMHRAAILTSDNVIRQAHLVNIIDAAQPQADLAVPRTGDELKRVKKAAREKSVEEIEKQFVLEALKRNDWNVTKSAEDTGMQRPNFQALMKKYAIRVRDTEHDARRYPGRIVRRSSPAASFRRGLPRPRSLVAGHHRLEVRRARVPERAEIDVDQDVEDEGDEDQHMHGVDHAHAAEEIDLRGETLARPTAGCRYRSGRGTTAS